MIGLNTAAACRAAARTAFFSMLICGGSTALWANAPSSGGRHPLLGRVVPQRASVGEVRQAGRLDSARKLDLVIHLPARDPDGLSAFLQQLQDPHSANYHKYMSVDEFTARFGPTQSDYDQVVAWANANGLTVTHTSVNRHIIDVTATVEAINQALDISMQAYQPVADDGKGTLFAPDSEPNISLSVPILKISGLDNFNPPQSRIKRNGGVAHIAPVATGSGPNGEFLPSDMRAAYYGSGPLTGAGQIIGIFSFDGYLSADVPLYYSALGIASPPNVPVTNVLVNGYTGACDAGDGSGLSTCDDGEQVLDIVNSIGMAPNASEVLFYEGFSGPDILNQIATDNLAKVISCSWGSGDLGGDDVLFQEFQAQGQTFVNATGDSGAYSATAWLPPSLNPYILQVGATSLVTTGGGGAYVSESAWPYAGGGYYVPAGYAIPSYQTATGVINALNEGSTTLRNDPDIAAEGDFDNPTISNGSLAADVGGTSYAAPRIAGFLTLANEQAIAHGQATAGFVNPSLYAIGTGANYASNFHDVTSGSNGFFAVAGYDLVTGWGSPSGQTLIDSLSAPSASPGFVISAYPSRVFLQRGLGLTSTVKVSTPDGFSGSVVLSASNLPSGVSASFNPTSISAGGTSTLTLTATAVADLGEASIAITGTSGTARTTSIRLAVGDAAHAVLGPDPLVITTQPNAKTLQEFDVGDAVDTVPLSYSIAAFASTDGSCTGSVAWLTSIVTQSTVTGGSTTALQLYVHPGNLAVGAYHAELCVTTNDPTQPQAVVPVTMNIVPGPAGDSIFKGTFETNAATHDGVYLYDVDQPVEDDQAGSALDLTTGSYHTWSGFLLDNINLYDDGTGLQVYWYNTSLGAPNRSKVGGVYDALSGSYKVLHSGDVVGPTATFNRKVTAMINFYGGVDGYIGIAFQNSQTGALNYGWIHITTSAPAGFPAQVLDYGFDNTGAAIRVP